LFGVARRLRARQGYSLVKITSHRSSPGFGGSPGT
jgi:hypothetical protein